MGTREQRRDESLELNCAPIGALPSMLRRRHRAA